MYDVDGFLYTFFIKDERSHVSVIAIWLARINRPPTIDGSEIPLISEWSMGQNCRSYCLDIILTEEKTYLMLFSRYIRI
jgi:hypothetical protein